MIAFAKKAGIPVSATAEKPYSTDRNLLHISYESGVLEDPWVDASAPELRDMYKLSVAPEDAPNDPEYVELEFESGNCVKVGGTRAVVSQNLRVDSAASSMSPLEVMQTLNQLGGKHGIGRVDIVENRYVGMKSRGVYETPGGAILHFAHRQMEGLTMDREVMHLRDSLIPKYSELVYNGYWFSPEREALQALVTETQRKVTGVVRLKLYKGSIIVAGRKSPNSLYDPQIATMEAGESAYNQNDATGFIRLNALRLKAQAALRDPKRDRAT
jgi:argininosuccinate synthase